MSVITSILFASEHQLDASFWRTVAAELRDEGFGLSFEPSSDEEQDTSKLDEWQPVSRVAVPLVGDRCWFLCDEPDSDPALLMVQWSEATGHDAPYCLPWEPEVRALLDARQLEMTVQFLDGEVDFGLAFLHAANRALDGVRSDAMTSTLFTANGIEYDWPEQRDEVPSSEPTHVRSSITFEVGPLGNPAADKLASEATVYARFGLVERARELLRSALALVPENPELGAALAALRRDS